MEPRPGNRTDSPHQADRQRVEEGEFGRRVDGWREAPLGRLYNPVYFHEGYAVHGASSVHDHPASHGCVRIPMGIAAYFPSLVDTGETIEVFRS